MLREDQLDEATHVLLASNTAERYTRKAWELATSFGLRALSEQSEAWKSAHSRAEDLWDQVLESDERSPAEIELAVLLVALSEGSSDEVSSLLKRIGMSTQRTATWLGALARRLSSERAGSDGGYVLSPGAESYVAPEVTESDSEDQEADADQQERTAASADADESSNLILPD